MSGLLTNGYPPAGALTGSEQAPFDTQLSQGQAPESVYITLQQIATASKFFGGSASTATVAGTRYYVSANLGTPLLTGIEVIVGATGGTDKFIVELHNSAGVIVATSALAGVTAGAAGSIQAIPFTATYQVPTAGTYFLVLQSNGTTATFQSYNAVSSTTLLTGSATGSFGTSANITPPTTYTASVGPVSQVY